MPLNTSAAGGGSDWAPVPAGTHIARCVTVVDLGLQETNFGPKNQVYIGFEIPGFTVEWEKDGQKHTGPGLIGQTYTNSIHEKSNLGAHLTAWRGRDFSEQEKEVFDLFNILDVPAMISVTHRTTSQGKTYANISGVMGVPPGTAVPDRVTGLMKYAIGDAETAGNLGSLPEWMQKKIKDGQEMYAKASENPEPARDTNVPQGVYQRQDDGSVVDDFDDDIPF